MVTKHFPWTMLCLLSSAFIHLSLFGTGFDAATVNTRYLPIAYATANRYMRSERFSVFLLERSKLIGAATGSVSRWTPDHTSCSPPSLASTTTSNFDPSGNG